MDFPFDQKKITESTALRTFSRDVEDSELIWHMDKEDRIVKVVKGDSWSLQMDNNLPFKLEEGNKYFIPKMTYHRVIKGSSDLVVEIQFLQLP